MPRRQPPIIGRTHLPIGISKCLDKADLLLDAARTLVKSSPIVTSALFSFAVEEFGKAALLKEALETGEEEVKIERFFDHQAKLREAMEYISRDILLVIADPFQSDAFQADAFQTDALITDFKTRLESLYVDWQNEK